MTSAFNKEWLVEPQMSTYKQAALSYVWPPPPYWRWPVHSTTMNNDAIIASWIKWLTCWGYRWLYA